MLLDPLKTEFQSTKSEKSTTFVLLVKVFGFGNYTTSNFYTIDNFELSFTDTLYKGRIIPF